MLVLTLSLVLVKTAHEIRTLAQRPAWVVSLVRDDGSSGFERLAGVS